VNNEEIVPQPVSLEPPRTLFFKKKPTVKRSGYSGSVH